jgi:alpha-tubulin suppressor-like RCC1 family protein
MPVSVKATGNAGLQLNGMYWIMNMHMKRWSWWRMIAKRVSAVGVAGVWMLMTCSSAYAATPTIGAGQAHSCALLSHGEVQCWGDNSMGQLGNGSTTASSKAVTVSGISNAIALAVGANHACAVVGSGTVQCWGAGSAGQLGTGETSNRSTPVTIKDVASVTTIAAGDNHTCVTLSSGLVKCWGDGAKGQLGQGSFQSSTIPVTVLDIVEAEVIYAGGQNSCALLTNRELRCWGVNNAGQLGNNTANNRNTPVMINGVSSATAVAVGTDHLCTHLNSGSVQCWGSNTKGQLGDGTQANSATVVSVSNLSNVRSLAANAQFNCAAQTSGLVNCWGSNTLGQLGTGNSVDLLKPATPVVNISSATRVAAGAAHACALLADGSIQCWGSNQLGQLGAATSSVNSTTPVVVQGLGNSVPSPTSLATDADAVFAWAERNYPSFFSPASTASQSVGGYRLRYYTGTNTYLGVNETGTAKLYYLGPATNNTLLDLGLLSDWVKMTR